MFGCWTWAAAWASFLKRLICLASCPAVNGRIFERDAPPERNLLGLVDDAHAAAADLADQLKIADRLGELQLAAGERNRLRRLRRERRRVEQLQAAQVAAQVRRRRPDAARAALPG